MKFKKTLAIFYHQWYRDCHDSVTFCNTVLHDSDGAAYYLNRANEYFNLIINNWDAIEYFSFGDRAFLIDSIHPIEFRGME